MSRSQKIAWGVAIAIIAALFVLMIATLPSHAERGLASFYGRGFEGHRTACGQIFRKSLYTAAHRTLPCGSLAQVCIPNGRCKIVMINDLGPAKRTGRIIDLSEATATYLGFHKAGTATIDLLVLYRGPHTGGRRGRK